MKAGQDQSIKLSTADLNALAEIVANAVAKATEPIVAQLKDLNAEVRNILTEAAESNCQLEEINEHTQKAAWNTTDLMNEVESIEASAYDLKRMAKMFPKPRRIGKALRESISEDEPRFGGIPASVDYPAYFAQRINAISCVIHDIATMLHKKE